jgi:prolyl 4-hydroxylase
MDSPVNRIQQAHELANRRDTGAAVALLEDGGRSGEADSWVELASWYLGGQIVPRDLAKSRECFRLAGDAGHQRARSIYISLLANGTGGPADWRSALDLLGQQIDEDSAREIDLLNKMELDGEGRPAKVATGERLSDKPDVMLFKQLLTKTECDYLIDRASPTLQPSVIVDPASGQMRPHPVRTSENAFFPWIDETPAIHAINKRLAAASGTAAENGEPLQILRYSPGQEYRPHHDALPHTDNQRILTMLVYLNDGYKGGETAFLSTGLKVKGAVGDALLFRNADRHGRPDPHAQHAGLPVIAGQKLIASRWIHEKRFGPR